MSFFMRNIEELNNESGMFNVGEFFTAKAQCRKDTQGVSHPLRPRVFAVNILRI